MPLYDVYYRKYPDFRCHHALTMKEVLDPEIFAKVRTVDAQDLEDLFMKQQGEVWSPNGEAKPLIQKLGLQHTSMSVGDVAIDENKRGWQVAPANWVEVRR